MKEKRSILVSFVAMILILTTILGCNFQALFTPQNTSFDEAMLMMIASREILGLYIPTETGTASAPMGGIVLVSQTASIQGDSKQQLNEQLALTQEFTRLANEAQRKGNEYLTNFFTSKANEHRLLAESLEKRRADWRRDHRFFYQVRRGMRSFSRALGNIIDFAAQAVFTSIQNRIQFYVNEIRAFLANPIRYTFDLALNRQLQIIKSQLIDRLGPFFGQRAYDLINIEQTAWNIEGNIFNRKTPQKTQTQANSQQVEQVETEDVPDSATLPPSLNESETVIIGNWHGTACDEAEGTYQYRWSVDLIQDPETDQFMGTIKFHACPGGGRVLYRVIGEPTTDPTVTLRGVKMDGGGDLYFNSPETTSFTVNLNNGAVTPNLGN